MPPMTESATTLGDHVLTVDVDAPSPYDTLVPCISLVEALVAGIVSRLSDDTRQRISTLEHLRKGYTRDDQEFPQGPEERET